MKKLKLNTSDIKVKSFVTSTADRTQQASERNGGGYTWVG